MAQISSDVFATQEAARLRKAVSECGRCEDDGWCPPIGPCADGSYITMRPCPFGCADKIEDAIRFETGKW